VEDAYVLFEATVQRAGIQFIEEDEDGGIGVRITRA